MSNAERPAGVVVGYDGSDTGAQVLEWAAAEATARRVPLTLAHVWEFTFAVPMAMPPIDLRAVAQEVLDAGLEHVGKTAPGLEVRSVLAQGSPAAQMIELSDRAEVVIVGSRGKGGFAGLVLGSVSAQVAAHASCPVVVVRGEDRPGPVVVGVDGSAGARAALAAAFAEADAHGSPLVAVVAWEPDPGTELPPFVDEDGLAEAAERGLDRLLAPLRELHPSVDVQARVMAGGAREVLTELSAEARLLVVGSRGLGGFRGLLLGSVSHALLHHAHCPVAIVR